MSQGIVLSVPLDLLRNDRFISLHLMHQADRWLMILSVVQTVSYAQFLYPTNALDRHKPTVDLALPMPYSRNSIPCSYPPSRLNSTVGLDLGMSHTHTLAHVDLCGPPLAIYCPQIC